MTARIWLVAACSSTASASRREVSASRASIPAPRSTGPSNTRPFVGGTKTVRARCHKQYRLVGACAGPVGRPVGQAPQTRLRPGHWLPLRVADECHKPESVHRRMCRRTEAALPRAVVEAEWLGRALDLAFQRLSAGEQVEKLGRVARV